MCTFIVTTYKGRNFRVSVTGGIEVERSTKRGSYWAIVHGKRRAGYIRLCLRQDGRMMYYNAHRIVAKAWLPGYSDTLQVHHINGDRSDNRVDNLRVGTNSDNQRGFLTPKGGYSVYRGVTKEGSRWRTQINIGGRHHSGGYHGTEIEAAKAYNLLALAHGFFPEALNVIEGES